MTHENEKKYWAEHPDNTKTLNKCEDEDCRPISSPSCHTKTEKPVYEYQWVYKRNDCKFSLSDLFYTYEEAKRDNDFIEPYEPSKREKKW